MATEDHTTESTSTTAEALEAFLTEHGFARLPSGLFHCPKCGAPRASIEDGGGEYGLVCTRDGDGGCGLLGGLYELETKFTWRGATNGTASAAAALDKSPSSGVVKPKPTQARAPLTLSKGDSVVSRPVEWLWRGRVPLRKVTFVDGEPGVNKSTVWLADIAARLTTGRAMPDGDHAFSEPRNVIISSTEDDADDTLVPRLVAAGADLSRVFFASVGERHLVLPQELDLLENAVKEVDAVLVLIDPVMAHADGTINTWKDQDVRIIMSELHAMSARRDCATALIRHVVKNQGTRAIYAGGGSVGLIGDARAGVMHIPDSEDETKRYLVTTKSNLAKHPDTLIYHVEGCDIVFPDGKRENYAKIRWAGSDERSADELLHDLREASHEKPGPKPEAQEAAEDFLAEVLKDGQEHRVKVVYEDADALGAFSKPTLQKVMTRKTKDGTLIRRQVAEGADRYWVVRLAAPAFVSETGLTPPTVAPMKGWHDV